MSLLEPPRYFRMSTGGKQQQHADGLGVIAEHQMTQSTDQALLELVRDGDERAFEALVLRYRRPLRSYCTRMGVPAQGTEDVVQQALLEAWLALRSGAQVHALKAWLYRIAHNIALDAIRETSRVETLACREAEHAVGTHSPTHEPGLHEALTAVAALPLLQREAIVRTALAGESHEQVGRYLGLTASAVRGLIYRGRATLRSALAALLPPWLPRLIASRGGASGGLRESFYGLATNASTAGSAGALVKVGVMVAVAATAITTTLPGPATHSSADRSPRGALARIQRSDRPAREAVPHPAQRSEVLRARTVVASRSSSGPARRPEEPTSSEPAGVPAAGSLAGERSGTGSAGDAPPETAQPVAGARSSAGTAAELSNAVTGGSDSTDAGGEAPSDSSTAPTGATNGGEQTGSSSGESGGPVGELAHTAEKTVEGTLGGLLHH
jgi:RNA polymerase sigma factor (sigma-70 family)